MSDGMPDPLREALERIVAGLDVAPGAPLAEREGCQCDLCEALRTAREALAAVPEGPEPVYEWRAINRHGLSVGFCVNESHAREWLQENPPGHIERRTPGTAPGPWERVEVEDGEG